MWNMRSSERTNSLRTSSGLTWRPFCRHDDQQRDAIEDWFRKSPGYELFAPSLPSGIMESSPLPDQLRKAAGFISNRSSIDCRELTECEVYSNSHIRLGRPALRNWRHLRSEARRDLPKLTAVARLLEQLVANGEGADRDEAADQLAAAGRRIEESKRRFSIE